MNKLIRFASLVLVCAVFTACPQSPPPLDTDAATSATTQPLPPQQAPSGVDPFQRTPNPNWKPTPAPSWYGQGPSDPNHKFGASTAFPPPVFQASWKVADWWIDPASGSDVNDCLTTSTPCKTYAQVAARWGTYSPRLRQDTTIHFKSSHTDNTDPVIFTPYIENGAHVLIRSVLPTPAFTGTLSSVVAKNRATPQTLKADLGFAATAGQFIVNTTHASRAWVFDPVAGTTFKISQPLAAVTPPFDGFTAPAEVDTWANTDAISIYSLTAVNLVRVLPQFDNYSGSFDNSLQIYQIKVFSPSGACSDVTEIRDTYFVESRADRSVMARTGTHYQDVWVNAHSICSTRSELQVGLPAFTNAQSGNVIVIGGVLAFSQLASVNLDGDVIMYGGNSVGLGSNLGLVNVDNKFTGSLVIVGPVDAQTAGFTRYTSNIVWGAGFINVKGGERLTYTTGAGGAAATFPSAGFVIKLNGGTTACSYAGTTTTCGITITPAALDTAADGTHFGGNAFVLGGAAITNGTL